MLSLASFVGRSAFLRFLAVTALIIVPPLQSYQTHHMLLHNCIITGGKSAIFCYGTSSTTIFRYGSSHLS